MVGHHETGNETYVLGLIDGFSSLNRDFELVVYETGHLIEQGGAHVRERRLSGGNAWTRLGIELPLRSWTDHLDLMHTTYTAPVWARCPVVLTVHDISFTDHPEWFSARDHRVLSRTVPWSIKRAARVITVSDLCAKQIVETYRVPAEKVVRVYNGPGRAAMAIEDHEARAVVDLLGLDAVRPIVLAVGNLQPRKNLIRLVDAFRRLLVGGLDADLVLVGPEHYRADLVHGAATDLHGRVHFTGYLTDRQLAAWYANATVFAFPSLFEGFGLPAVEAMSHGTPVACARAGALPEVCGDAAIYFDPYDTDSIASALNAVLRDGGLRQRLSRAGRLRQEQFNWTRAAEETLVVYEQAIRA